MAFHRVPSHFGFSSVLNLYSFARETAAMLRGASHDAVISHDRTACQDLAVIHTFSYKSGIEKYSPFRKIDMLYLSPRSWLHLWLEKRQMRTPRLAAVSRAVREDIHRHYGATNPVDVITPGIDTQFFNPVHVARDRRRIRKEEGIPESDMVVLFVGSEFKRKGLDRLIPAIKSGMRLLVAGRGENLAYYRKLAKTSGAAKRVVYLGLTTDIRRYYACADVVALPSRVEAFGMSILEAMACGLPVVTSANAGCAPLIEDGANGYMVRDASELPAILDRLRDSDLRARLGYRARAVAQRHSWDAAADHFETCFFQIADAKKEKRPRVAQLK
jgi:UDP-glucose:(heptosyl)LPS alpha-1,3-glucosyltransferase